MKEAIYKVATGDFRCQDIHLRVFHLWNSVGFGCLRWTASCIMAIIASWQAPASFHKKLQLLARAQTGIWCVAYSLVNALLEINSIGLPASPLAICTCCSRHYIE